VVRISRPGLRINKQEIAKLVPKVADALAKMDQDDVSIIQIMDNSAYLMRTEDGSELLTTTDDKGDHHVEGDLVLASLDRQRMLVDTLEPLLALFSKRPVMVITPMPRYLYKPCCAQESHAPNRLQAGFEDNLREGLSDLRSNIKKFLFRRNIRATVLDPSPVLQYRDSNGTVLWGKDPVHPLQAGYNAVADLITQELDRASTKGKKRSGGPATGAAKRPRLEPRPAWIEGAGETAVRRDWPDGAAATRGRRGYYLSFKGRGGGPAPGGRGSRGGHRKNY
jgi:hypothetical protein